MISLVIPVYDFEGGIKRSLGMLSGFAAGKAAWLGGLEVIFVDDGSRDGTVRIIEEHMDGSFMRLIRLPHNQGKGAAVKAGVREARGEYILFTDADLPYELAAVAGAMRLLADGADVVLGTRIHPGAEHAASAGLKRGIMSYVFNRAANLLLIERVRDTQSGFKGFRAAAARKIMEQVTISGYAFDVELIRLAQIGGCRIAVMPVKLVDDSKASTVRVFRDSLRMLRDLSRLYRRANTATGPALARHDFIYGILISEAIVALSVPTLQNIQVFHLLSRHGSAAIAVFVIGLVLLFPACVLGGLYILHSIPLFSPTARNQFGRYAIVGLFNTFLNAAVFNALSLYFHVSRGWPVVLFLVIAFIIVNLQAFLWSKYWTFRGTSPYSHAEYVKFFLVSGVMAVINICLVQFLVNVVGSPVWIDPRVWANIALGLTIVTSLLGNFFGYRLFVFKNAATPDKPMMA